MGIGFQMGQILWDFISVRYVCVGLACGIFHWPAQTLKTEQLYNFYICNQWRSTFSYFQNTPTVCNKVQMTQNCIKLICWSNSTEIFNKDGLLLLYFNIELPAPFAREKMPQASISVSQTQGSRCPAPNAPNAQKNFIWPDFFSFGANVWRILFSPPFYFFLCYKRYELRKRLMTPNKQCRWRVFLNWWWPLVIIGYKVRPFIDTYLVDWTWCLFN